MLFVINIWIAIHIFNILPSTTNGLTLTPPTISDAIIEDVKMLTTIKAHHYTYKTNIIYFTNKTEILLDYFDDMSSKRILLRLNESSSLELRPEDDCKQFEIIMSDANTTITFVCLNGVQLGYDKFMHPLPEPSEYTTDCRIIILIENFNDIHQLATVIVRHPNLIKIVYAHNDCDLIEFDLFKYYTFLWDINRILHVQYVSHCKTNRNTQIYTFKPFVRNHYGSFDVFGAITKQVFTKNIIVNLVFRNFNGYKLDVLFFPTTMAYLKSDLNLAILKRDGRHKEIEYEIRDLNSYYGVDVNVLQMWIQMNNFTVNTIPTTDGAFYGFREENGTFNGGLGDIIYKRVDFIANGYFIKDYESRLIEFSHAILSEKLCLVVKTADLVPSSLILVRCFSFEVWFSMVITLIVVGMMYGFLLQKTQMLFNCNVTKLTEFGCGNQKNAMNLISKYIEIMFQIMGLLLSAPIGNIGHMQYQRIFLTACFLWSLNISGAFQGSLVDVYTTPTSYPNIDTLDELDKINYPIAVRHQGLIVDVFGSDGRGNTIGNLRSKLYPTEDNFLAAKIAHRGKLAGLERLADFQVRKSEFLRSDGVSYLHLVKECPRGYLLSYLFPKSSIFLEMINFDLNLLLQSGLISKWEKDTFYLEKFAESLEHRKFLRPSTITLTLNHLQVAFFILVLGNVLSMFICLLEINFKSKQFVKH